MDFVKNALGGDNKQENVQGGNNQPGEQQGQQQQQGGSSGGGFLSGLGDKFNSAAGGGRESEKNEDYLDKGPFFLSHLVLPLSLSLAVDLVLGKKEKSSLDEDKTTGC